jgi:hypothetical protein
VTIEPDKEWWAVNVMGRVPRVVQGRQAACDYALACLNQHGGPCTGCNIRDELANVLENGRDYGTVVRIHPQSPGYMGVMGRVLGPGEPDPDPQWDRPAANIYDPNAN